jgi:2-polyprenyl-3-methyl-5-hydroxy-6-metoxy-1,4-benzoquinol methylase
MIRKIIRRVLGEPNTENPVQEEQPELDTSVVQVEKHHIKTVLSDSWKDPSIPQKQYESCTKNELEDYAKGLSIEPFDVLVNILKDTVPNLHEKSILEVGCSSGYYSEVLRMKGISAKYHGCDYSESFVNFAKELFPTVDFQAQDACGLTYQDRLFDIVISGGCLLHIIDYEKAIQETARVAKKYVVFHRTPVVHAMETSYYMKTAYDVEMFEIHFNDRELLRLFRNSGLRVVDIITFHTSFDESTQDFCAYKTYLCEKD